MFEKEKQFVELANMYFEENLTDEEIAKKTDKYGNSEEVHNHRVEQGILHKPYSMWLVRHRARLISGMIEPKSMLDVKFKRYIKGVAERYYKINDLYSVDITDTIITVLAMSSTETETDETLFEQQEEHDLFNAIRKITFGDSYEGYMNNLINIDSTVTKYLDNVFVNDTRENISKNRKRLLTSLESLYFEICDWTKLKKVKNDRH